MNNLFGSHQHAHSGSVPLYEYLKLIPLQSPFPLYRGKLEKTLIHERSDVEQPFCYSDINKTCRSSSSGMSPVNTEVAERFARHGRSRTHDLEHLLRISIISSALLMNDNPSAGIAS